MRVPVKQVFVNFVTMKGDTGIEGFQSYRYRRVVNLFLALHYSIMESSFVSWVKSGDCSCAFFKFGLNPHIVGEMRGINVLSLHLLHRKAQTFLALWG